MATNQDRVHENYASGKEDIRATQPRASGLEFHYTKKLLGEYIKNDSRVIETGYLSKSLYLSDGVRYVG